jgi:hypothetical protein
MMQLGPMRTWLPALLLLSACHPSSPGAVSPASTCTTGSNRWVREQIYFGRNIGASGEVSDQQWQQFLESEIMPRFTDGLTLVQAQGQWKSEAGPLVRERSWLLVLYHPAEVTVDRKVEEVISAYKKAFSQEAVLRDRDMTCVTL